VGDAAGVQGGEALGREGVGVEGHQRIRRLVLLERVIQGEQAREIVCVGDKGCPDWDFTVSAGPICEIISST
jgi:hypothetical protein